MLLKGHEGDKKDMPSLGVHIGVKDLEAGGFVISVVS